MVGQGMLRTLVLGVSCLLCTSLVAQGKTVAGTVRNEENKPIMGATVRLVVRRLSVAPELGASLPSARTDAEGRFTLPIAAAQMATGGDWPGIVMRVDADGYQSWCEPVPSPLGLFDGGDATMRRLRDEDRAVIRVERPEPGMLVLVERSGTSYMPAVDDPVVWADGPPATGCELLEVPEQRELSVHLPLLPTPLVIPAGQHGFVPLGWHVRLVFPGRSSARRSIAAGETVTFEAPRAASESRVVRRQDGAVLRGLRVLIDLGGGRAPWDTEG